MAERRYTCYACAIMPDHVHALIRRHRDHAEEMIANLQEGSRAALIAAGYEPDRPSAWLIEGLLYYIPEPDVHRILGTVQNLTAPGSLVAAEIAVGRRESGEVHPGQQRLIAGPVVEVRACHACRPKSSAMEPTAECDDPRPACDPARELEGAVELDPHGARIRSRGQGDDNRRTFWCPRCQR